MHLSEPGQDTFVPDETALPEALARTTHLAIGAHQDDIEFMALHGILECFGRADKWFGAVTCTDGAGSARSGPYAGCSDDAMQAIRAAEQRAAAAAGRYGCAVQLAHASKAAKEPAGRKALVDDLETILALAQPACVYTHNPFDRHATHLGVLSAVLEAIQRLPVGARPSRLLGCEVWRGLDWLPEADKIVLPVDAHPNLAAALCGLYDSQISGGKRYDLAVEGRRRANATFLESHAVDGAGRVDYAIDLTALTRDGTAALDTFAQAVLDRFEAGITGALKKTRSPS